MEEIISFEELKNLTSQVKEDKKSKLMERVQLARNDAVSHITQGCYDKMKQSAINGHNSAVIYSFEWTQDVDALTDLHGNKVVFEGGIRLLDLIKKDNKQFFDDLNKFFNKNDNEKFHCGFRKENINNVNKWSIYVSWADKNIDDKYEIKKQPYAKYDNKSKYNNNNTKQYKQKL